MGGESFTISPDESEGNRKKGDFYLFSIWSAVENMIA